LRVVPLRNADLNISPENKEGHVESGHGELLRVSDPATMVRLLAQGKLGAAGRGEDVHVFPVGKRSFAAAPRALVHFRDVQARGAPLEVAREVARRSLAVGRGTSCKVEMVHEAHEARIGTEDIFGFANGYALHLSVDPWFVACATAGMLPFWLSFAEH